MKSVVFAVLGFVLLSVTTVDAMFMCSCCPDRAENQRDVENQRNDDLERLVGPRTGRDVENQKNDDYLASLVDPRTGMIPIRTVIREYASYEGLSYWDSISVSVQPEPDFRQLGNQQYWQDLRTEYANRAVSWFRDKYDKYGWYTISMD